MADDAGHGIFLVRPDRAALETGRIETVMARRGHGLLRRLLGAASVQEPHRPPALALVQAVQTVARGDASLAAGAGVEIDLEIGRADAVDSLLIRDDLHDLVSGLAIIVEHGVPGCAGNASGKLIGTQDHGLDQLLFFRAKIDVAADPANGDDQDGERKDQLRAEFSRHSRGSQRLPGIEVFGPNCIGPYLIKAIWGKARAP